MRNNSMGKNGLFGGLSGSTFLAVAVVVLMLGSVFAVLATVSSEGNDRGTKDGPTLKNYCYNYGGVDAYKGYYINNTGQEGVTVFWTTRSHDRTVYRGRPTPLLDMYIYYGSPNNLTRLDVGTSPAWPSPDDITYKSQFTFIYENATGFVGWTYTKDSGDTTPKALDRTRMVRMPSPNAVVSGTNIDLTWSAPSMTLVSEQDANTDITDINAQLVGYLVYRSTTNATWNDNASVAPVVGSPSDWTLVGGSVSSPITVTSWTDTTVVIGTAYYYSLKLVFNGSANVSTMWGSQGSSPFIIPSPGPVHNLDKDTYYQTIQAGVDDADPGNRIFVSAGTYYENVIINKTLTLIGEDRDTTIIDGGYKNYHAEYNGTIQGSSPSVGYNFSCVNYTFLVEDGAEIAVIAASCDKDADLYIYDSDGNLVDSSATTEHNETIELNASQLSKTGEWKVLVHHFSGVSDVDNPANYHLVIDISGSGTGDVVYISADWVNVSGFGVRNGGEGVYLYHSSNNQIINCICYNNSYAGIYFHYSSDNSIVNCVCHSNSDYGILFRYSSNNTIIDSVFLDNHIGISISSNNSVVHCVCYNSSLEGIHLSSSSDNVITDCICHSNYRGICLQSSSTRNQITGCVCYNNTYEGILFCDSSNNTLANCIVYNNSNGTLLYYSSNNKITNCTMYNNSWGIYLYDSLSNGITNNSVYNNSYGIYLYSSYLYPSYIYSSSNNYIYHNNFIDNTNQAYDSCSNFWDNGYPSGGNYWSDYTGVDLYSGPGQNISGSDGIGDTPYNISGGANADRYPLMSPWSIGPVHNLDKDTYYQTIQAGVDDADPGNRIFVSAGTYYENVIINKTLTLIGEDRNTTIIDGSGTGDVVYIEADWVNLSGFGMRNSGSGSYPDQDAGIDVRSSNNAISSCSVYSNSNVGIYLSFSSNNQIRNNSIYSNIGYGVSLDCSCNSNTISNNSISNNGGGINIGYSSENTIANNTLSDHGLFIGGTSLSHFVQKIYTNNLVNNKPIYYFLNQSDIVIDGWDVGQIFFVNCTNCRVNNVNTSYAHVGIEIAFSSYVTIENSILSNNFFSGIYLVHSSANTITNNSVSNNLYGIYLWHSSDNNTIIYNSIMENTPYGDTPSGLCIDSSNYNRIHHNNFVNNNVGGGYGQAYDNTGTNFWDNGYPSGGNYWSDYTGVDLYSGVNQDEPGSDGIGDTPYNISGGSNKDRYPLMEPWSITPNQPPVVHITYPADGQTVNDTVNIMGYTSDPDWDVSDVYIKFDNGDWQYVGSGPPTAVWIYSWDTTNISDGWHTIYARAFDGTDYSEIVSVSVYVDNPTVNQPPVMNITYPAEGQTVNGTVTITGNASDSDGIGMVQVVEVKIDDGSWQLAGTFDYMPYAYWYFDWNTTTVSNGWHTIYARAYDGTDYSAIVSVNVNVSNPVEMPDLTLTPDDIAFSNNYPTVGETIIINATIHNIGSGTAKNVTVRFLIPKQNFTEITVPIISSSEFRNVYLSWIPEYTGEYVIIIWIDPNNEIIESNETNNDAGKVLTVGGNQPPTAYIDFITPNPATLDEIVSFIGHGNDTDGYIIEYYWHSSIDGFLSNQSSFSLSNLSVGNHIICFWVKDNNNTYSAPVTENLTILSYNQPPIASFVYYQGIQAINGEYVNVTLRVAGEKYRIVNLTVYENGNKVGFVSVERIPGKPEENTTSILIDSSKLYTILLEYTAEKKGGNSVWVIVEYRDISYTEHFVFHEDDMKNLSLTEILETMLYSTGFVKFDASSSYDSDGEIVNYTWNFGDGAYGYGMIVEHNYAPGNYTVSLTVRDNNGATNTTSKHISTVDFTGYCAAYKGKYYGVSLHCPADLTITNRTGAFIGYNSTSGKHENWLPNATMILSGESEIYLIPKGPGDFEPGDFAVLGRGPGDFSFLVFDPGDFEPGDFNPGDFEPGDFSGRIYQINSDVTSGSLDEIKITADGNNISIKSDTDKFYSLYITNGTQTFTVRDVPLNRNATHTLQITNWSAINSTTIASVNLTIDELSDGIVDRVEELWNNFNIADKFKPDLTVTIEVSNSNPAPGENISVYITLKNIGEGPARNIKVRFLVDNVPYGEDYEIALLWRDGIANITFYWTAKEGTHELSVLVDPEHVIAELNENNNEASINIGVKGAGAVQIAPITPQTVAIVGGIITNTIVIAAVLFGTEVGKYSLFSLFGPLFVKRKGAVLDQFTRGRIYEHIKLNPGVHYNSIRDSLELGNGTLSYHLSILEKEGYIKSETEGMYKRFYSAGRANSFEKAHLPLSDLQQDIVDLVKSSPGITQKEITVLTNKAHQVISYNIKVLTRLGVINERKEGLKKKLYLEEKYAE